jgi:segregation and condensation protein A
MGYEVRTSVFEGPFDLLLHLILRQEVDLWEVSLAPIIDGYLAELERMHALDLELATEFLLIAATLIELKTRRLLPGPADLELDEELLRFEERDLLLARLLECKTFKDAAGSIQALINRAALSVPRLAGPEEPYRSLVPEPLERVRLDAPSLRDPVRSSTPSTSHRSAPASPKPSWRCWGACGPAGPSSSVSSWPTPTRASR